MSGWVKLYRKIWDWPFSSDSDYVAVWVYLLTHAAHQEHSVLFNGSKVTINAGQLVTGRKVISEKTGVSESKIQRILKCLESEQQIKQLTSPRSRLISLLQWEYYQDGEQQIEHQMNNRRTTDEQLMNTYKNVKNGKKEKKGGKPPKEKVDDIPYDKVVSKFNETCTSLESVVVLTETRKASIRARWNDGYRLEDFQKVFTNCEGSDHHSGRSGKWAADFNWLLKPQNFDKMLLKKNVEPPKKFPFTLPQDEYGYNGGIYPELHGQRFYVENWEEGRVFDEQGNELVKIWCLGDMDYGPRL